jgi:serine phosphatase RsbU (regulator of sigma subunit)
MKKHPYKYHTCLLFLVVFFVSHLQAEVLPSDKIKSDLNIESYLEIYKGTSNDPYIIEKASANEFKPFNWNDIPDKNSVNWLKLVIDNTNRNEDKLVIGNNQFHFLEFYEKDDTEEFKIKLSGTMCNHDVMDVVLGADSWFSFTLPSNKVSVFLIRASNNYKVKYQYSKLPFTIYKYQDFKKFQSLQNFFNYFFWGALLIITFYNLVLYFQLKSRIYIYYVFNNLIILLFVLSQSGLISELFFSSSRYHEHLLLVFGNIAFIFYMMFCKEYLNLKVTRPRLNAILNKILVFWPLPLILIYFDLSEVAVSIGGLIAIWAYTMIMNTAYRAIKKGDTGARFFFIANVFYYIGIIVSILQIANVLPSLFLGLSSVNYVQIGTLLQVSLFSLTVGFRIVKMQNEITERQIEQERVKADEEHKRRVLIEEQNVLLERKVMERTLELENSNEELKTQSNLLEFQKTLLEERQKEIIDSITYAKRIQYTLLAHASLLEKYLPQHFILFEPKDIVSGDFYWASAIKTSVVDGGRNLFYFAICDCTGHGVPGAFMSLLNISFLNEAINEKNIYAPNEILDYVRTRLESSVSQDGGKDGMDGTLLCFEEGSSVINYASAYNKPILVREGLVIDLPFDKMPVGKGERHQAFTQHTIHIQKGDRLYFYTDGFADQFGGPKGKKFKNKQLNELIKANHALPPEEQKQKLLNAFQSWKGMEEQVDDVCVFGLSY